jgi:chromodomain-helicase-DNA-binding protein 7
MRPYVLRRVKAHVEKSVPPKEEIVVSVALAPLQKRYYRALYEKNVLMLAGTGRPVDGPSLMNLAMELRKCCNHPFLLKGVERQEEARLTGQTERERLVGACGKFQFLDKLLPRLFQEANRKVLIFSQFVMMLDVLSDYLRSAKYAHGRVDGGVTGRDRQKQIDQFAQQGDGAVRVMLLSTRAGGVGINLVAADTVVVYDSVLTQRLFRPFPKFKLRRRRRRDASTCPSERLRVSYVNGDNVAIVYVPHRTGTPKMMCKRWRGATASGRRGKLLFIDY